MKELEPEFISLYYGEDVSEDEAEEAAAIVRARFTEAEVSVVNGGQPVYYYLISAE